MIVALVGVAVTAMAWTQNHSGYADVPDDHYAADAVAWAAEHGITSGCAPDRFCPDDTLTRAQVVTFLYRYHLMHDEIGLPPTTTTTRSAPTWDGASTGPAPEHGPITIGDQTYWPPHGGWANDTLFTLRKITIAPENCAGSDRASFEGIPSQIYVGALGYRLGYLTYEVLTSGDIDHLVAVHEAWCSGIRDPKFGSDLYNLFASNSSVNRSKGGRDPLEWWNTDGRYTPRKVDYPGWCQYLYFHVEIKHQYGATMDQAEWDFVRDQVAKCGDAPSR